MTTVTINITGDYTIAIASAADVPVALAFAASWTDESGADQWLLEDGRASRNPAMDPQEGISAPLSKTGLGITSGSYRATYTLNTNTPLGGDGARLRLGANDFGEFHRYAGTYIEEITTDGSIDRARFEGFENFRGSITNFTLVKTA